MSIFKKMIKAIFVMPFFAGRLKTKRTDSLFEHDGSTSAMVLLVSFIVIAFETLLIGSSNAAKKFIRIDISVLVQIGTSCCAIICYVFISVCSSLKPSVLNINREWNICNKIRLKFLWLFTLTNIVYYIINLIFQIECLMQYVIGNSKVYGRIVLDCFWIAFVFVQSAFLTRFCQYTFKSVLGIYFSLMLVFTANVSIIAIGFARVYRQAFDSTVNNSETANNTIDCYVNSSTATLLNYSEAYLDPTILEYSLVSVIFISDLWPAQSTTARGSESNYENIDDVRNDILNVNTHNGVNDQEQCKKRERRTRQYVVVVLCAMLNVPLLILYILRVTGNTSVDEALYIYYCVMITFLTLMFIKCYYLMQTECKPRESGHTFSSNDYVLVATLLGTIAYYTMRLIPYILLLHTGRINIIKTYVSVFLIISTYYEAVFLLQMSHYEKRKATQSTWTFIEYACLYLAVQNMILWINDTFIASQYIVTTDATYTFYGKDTWVRFFIFLFPFVVFYHFNCFVSFLGLYYRLKS